MISFKTAAYRSGIFLLCTTVFFETLYIGIIISEKAPNLRDLSDNEAVPAVSRMRRQALSVGDDRNDYTDSSELYLPLYAKLSNKSLKTICEQRSKRRKKKHEKWNRTKNTANNSTRLRRLNNNRGCGLIRSISQPHILARRLNKVGGIVRHGSRWFQTEYSLGYNVFEYRNLTKLRHSSPSIVHSLHNAQFDGTDNTVCDADTFVYYSAATSQIHSCRISEKSSKSAAIHTSKTPIYQLSYSYVDLDNDGDGHIWILYHSISDGSLRVSFRDCTTLAESKSWTLQFLDTNTLVNAFIACNRLYALSQNSTSNILNVLYDFSAEKRLAKIPEIGSWKRYGIPSSVQYDHSSETINVFDDGLIYSITARMN